MVSYLLSAGAAVLPNIPGPFDSLFGSDLANIRGCDAFIIAIIPFPDIFSHFNLSFTLETGTIGGAMWCPRKRTVQPKIEQLKRALSTSPGRHISVRHISFAIDTVTMLEAMDKWYGQRSASIS